MSEQRLRLDYLAGGLLRAQDYEREQGYHLDTQRTRARNLHTWGIADGLQVSLTAAPMVVSVAAGMAVDAQGREIVLASAQTVDLSALVYTPIWLVMRYHESRADWRIFAAGDGDTRIVETAIIEPMRTEPIPDGGVILLARLDVAPDRRLFAPDASARRLCGLTVGSIDFPRPGVPPASWPSLSIDPATSALIVTANYVDMFGSMLVQGRVAIGALAATPPKSPGDPPSTLEIRSPTPQQATGHISLKGDIAIGDSEADLSQLVPSDHLLVTSSKDLPPIELEVTRSIGPNAVAVTTPAPGPFAALAAAPPVPVFADASFAVVPSTLIRVRTGALEPALTLAAVTGRVGIGRAPGSVALSVGDGAIRLDQGSVVRFLTDGQVLTKDSTFVLSFGDSIKTLAVSEAGDISFVLDEKDVPPGMVITHRQRVGIGTADPASTLTVDGIIRASDGLEFPDGTEQDKAVIAIPLGTVFDWWRPPNSGTWTGEGFQLCDGSTITDPASPLVGQKTPDLRERFVRGVISFDQVGKTGGAATHLHTFTFASHTHPIAHLHAVRGNTGPPGQTAGDSGIEGSRSISSDSHTHVIDTLSGPSNPSSSLSSQPAQGQTGSASNVPSYMWLLKVMRIR